MSEKTARSTGVLARDRIGGSQRCSPPLRHVSEVSDGGADQNELSDTHRISN